jgi:hypothetical protein
MHGPPVGMYRPVVDRVLIVRIVRIEGTLQQFSSVGSIGRMYPADPACVIGRLSGRQANDGPVSVVPNQLLVVSIELVEPPARQS